MTSKNCTICKKTKSTKAFYLNRSRSDGLDSQCRECANITNKKYKRSREGVITRIHGGQLVSSKRRSHDAPAYSKTELKAWIYSQPRFEVLYMAWVESGYQSLLTPSVDREDDYKPYTIGNLLRVCTWRENMERSHKDRLNGINNKSSTPVIQMNLDGTLVQEHYSMRAAERRSGVANGNISSCCRGKSKSAGGFRWMVSIGFPCVGLGV